MVQYDVTMTIKQTLFNSAANLLLKVYLYMELLLEQFKTKMSYSINFFTNWPHVMTGSLIFFFLKAGLGGN